MPGRRHVFIALPLILKHNSKTIKESNKMTILSNRRGQGSDTFKLLIAAVVAMVILGIVTGVFQNIWTMVGGITCVSSPINELVTKIQKAQAGITTSTDAICMNAGEQFSSTALTEKVTNVGQITFKCSGAAVCKNNNPVDVSGGNTIKSMGSVKFKGLITCTKSGTAGDYNCDIEIQSA